MSEFSRIPLPNAQISISLQAIRRQSPTPPSAQPTKSLTDVSRAPFAPSAQRLSFAKGFRPEGGLVEAENDGPQLAQDARSLTRSHWSMAC